MFEKNFRHFSKIQKNKIWNEKNEKYPNIKIYKSELNWKYMFQANFSRYLFFMDFVLYFLWSRCSFFLFCCLLQYGISGISKKINFTGKIFFFLFYISCSKFNSRTDAYSHVGRWVFDRLNLLFFNTFLFRHLSFIPDKVWVD